MKKSNNRIIRKYLREIRHFLPVYHHVEKRYITDVQNAIEDYVTNTKDLSFDMLIAEFGEPKDLASNYILEQEASTLRNAMRFSNYIKIITLSAILALFAIISIRGYAEYQHFQEGKDAYIQREVTVIQEIEETEE